MTSARRLSAFLLVGLLLVPTLLFAQTGNDKVKWSILTPKVTGAPGEIVQVKLKGVIEAGEHIYSTKSYNVDGPTPTAFTVGERSVASLAGRVKGPTPKTKHDEGFEIDVEIWEGTITLNVPVKIAKDAKPGTQEAWVNAYFQVCNEGRCLPAVNKKVPFTIEVAEGATGSADSLKQAQMLAQAARDSVDELRRDSASAAKRSADSLAALGTAKSDTTVKSAAATPAGEKVAAASDEGGRDAANATAEDIEKAKREGILAFIVLALLGGFASLLTPCVYPMIPITISFFTKRPNATRARVIGDASLYALGIIGTFTVVGVGVSAIFGSQAISNFAAHPITNVAIGVLFVVFALSLFGMFDIQLPSGLMNKLNAKADGNGAGSVILMGAVFALTSFTCTAPIVGGLLVGASRGDFLWPALGMISYGAAFALPFFLLALFPAAMKSMPKSGGWLNSVKVVLGFLEIAAALKFIASADVTWQWGVFTRDMVLACWVAVSVLTTVYLLGRFQMTHDTPVERIGGMRALLAVVFLSFGVWLGTGLLGKNLGEVEAMFPAALNEGGAAPAAGGAGAVEAAKEEWIQDDYPRALELARKTGRPLFVDFTGYNCTNCRLMERKMFPLPEIKALMGRYILVRLYTDRPNDETNQRQQEMMQKRYSTVALPYYAVLTPGDSTVATFGGMTRDPKTFSSFLRKGIEAVENKMAAR